MSRISLSKELLEQLAQGRGTSRWRYDGVDAPADYALRAVEREIAAPVSLARELIAHGLSPRAAHDAVTRLAESLARPLHEREPVPLHVRGVAEPAAFEAALAKHGVAAERRRVPEKVDVAAIRAKLGLTREAFAIRFGFDARTVEAWEQGRYRPEPATRTLLKIIERDPAIVEAVLAAA
jgi:DNA-binding transcriptional regulator YiaG